LIHSELCLLEVFKTALFCAPVAEFLRKLNSFHVLILRVRLRLAFNSSDCAKGHY
jgi:hypothetical protein